MTGTSKEKDQQPLPFPDILHDLALLRTFDIDMAKVFDMAKVLPDSNNPTKGDADVDASYEFVKQARAALRIQDRGDLGTAGDSVERVREGMEEILKGLERPSS